MLQIAKVKPTARAAQICNVECLKILIASGADLNAVDNTRMTPLMYASEQHSIVRYSNMSVRIPFKDDIRQNSVKQ